MTSSLSDVSNSHPSDLGFLAIRTSLSDVSNSHPSDLGFLAIRTSLSDVSNSHPCDLGFLAGGGECVDGGFKIGGTIWEKLGEWNYPAQVHSEFDQKIASIKWTYDSVESPDQRKSDMVGMFLSAVINSDYAVLRGCQIRTQYESFAMKNGVKTILSDRLHDIIKLVTEVEDDVLVDILLICERRADWCLSIDLQELRTRLIAKGIYYPFLTI
jgi:hypothetical protein